MLRYIFRLVFPIYLYTFILSIFVAQGIRAIAANAAESATIIPSITERVKIGESSRVINHITSGTSKSEIAICENNDNPDAIDCLTTCASLVKSNLGKRILNIMPRNANATDENIPIKTIKIQYMGEIPIAIDIHIPLITEIGREIIICGKVFPKTIAREVIGIDLIIQKECPSRDRVQADIKPSEDENTAAIAIKGMRKSSVLTKKPRRSATFTNANTERTSGIMKPSPPLSI